jgi:predicted DNA-binding ribbon-helix-helix protein
MKSLVVKRSVVLAGHKTSVSLEDAFWERLKDIAKSRRMALCDLISRIDVDCEHGNLSSALRLFVFNHYMRPMSSRLNGTMSNADIATPIETVQSAIA